MRAIRHDKGLNNPAGLIQNGLAFTADQGIGPFVGHEIYASAGEMPVQQGWQLPDGRCVINDGADRDGMRFAAFAGKRFSKQVGRVRETKHV